VIRGRYPASLASLAMACLAKDPGDRPTMTEVAERLRAPRSRRRLVRALWIAPLVVAALCAVAIAMPSLLDPLCSDWFGAAPFRLARRGARAAHAAIFSEPAGPAAPAKPHARPREHR
jgi:hypothetical protein